MYKRNNYKMYIIGSIILSVIALTGLIYAAFTGQLNIRGTSVNRHSKWDVHFENLSTITTTHTAKVLDNKEPKIGDDLLSITDYDVSLTTPGDSISFTFDVVNEGNYNAKITAINIDTPECTGSDETSNNNVCNNITYTLTQASGSSVNVNDVIYAKDHLTLKVTLTYKDTVTASELATSDVSISNLGITIDFEQSSDALIKDNGEVANYRVYHQGDKITVNNEDYWIIARSGIGQDYVVALKDEPLTVEEVNLYGSSISVSAGNQNGYGKMAFGSTNEYSTSNIKIVVDTWANDKFANDILKEIDGYKSRLLMESDFMVLGYSGRYVHGYTNVSNVPNFVYSYTDYYTAYKSTRGAITYVAVDGQIISGGGPQPHVERLVRPVINVYKSALENNNG